MARIVDENRATNEAFQLPPRTRPHHPLTHLLNGSHSPARSLACHPSKARAHRPKTLGTLSLWT